jgi:hypothetical protein
MLTHQHQLQHRPLLVSRIPLLLQYFLIHVCLRLQIQNNYVYLQLDSSYIRLQFMSSCIILQFEISRVDLHLKPEVPCSLHLIKHNQMRQRMYVAGVYRSSERCRPREQRAKSH